jgi:hypothetical protein
MYAISGIVRMQSVVFIFHCRKVIEIKNAIVSIIFIILFKAITFQLDFDWDSKENHAGNTEHKITLIWFAFANSAIEKILLSFLKSWGLYYQQCH